MDYLLFKIGLGLVLDSYCGGKGRHTRFKIWWQGPYEFKSHQW